MRLDRSRPRSSAGIWIGAACWATSTQLNYSLVPMICASGMRLTLWIALVLALLSLVGAWLSWSSLRELGGPVQSNEPEAGTPFRMMAAIGTAVGVLFAVIIVLQGTAALFLTGCEP